MISYPNSYNTSFILFRVKTAVDKLGNKSWRLVGSKEVGGVISSISSKEYYSSIQTKVLFDFKVSIQSFIYDGASMLTFPTTAKSMKSKEYI